MLDFSLTCANQQREVEQLALSIVTDTGKRARKYACSHCSAAFRLKEPRTYGKLARGGERANRTDEEGNSYFEGAHNPKLTVG